MSGNLREQYGSDSNQDSRFITEPDSDERRQGKSTSGRRKRAASLRNHRGSRECSAQVAINLIQGKWKTRILSQLQHGPARLGELQRMFPQASKKMLSQHLREMERDGLVVRSDLSARVLHVEYSLSDSGGLAVLHLIRLLRDWSKTHLPIRAPGSGNFRVAASDTGPHQSQTHHPQA